MKFILFHLLLTLLPVSLFAHNPLSARYELNQEDNHWTLNINLSQSGLEQALLKQYSKESLNTKTTTQLKQLIIEYIKPRFVLKVNGEKITLKDGGLRLGNHQTDLKFILADLPQKIEEATISIPAFKENKQHQTIFFHHLNGQAEHLVLSTNNDYQAIIIEAPKSKLTTYLLITLGALLFIALIYYLLAR